MAVSFKRMFQKNVGGGVDRDKLADSDFAIPSERKFPVVKPGDVQDAVSSWGRYKGPISFDTFKANLIKLAKRKGEAFVKQLPASWEVESKEWEGATADLAILTIAAIAVVLSLGMMIVVNHMSNCVRSGLQAVASGGPMQRIRLTIGILA